MSLLPLEFEHNPLFILYIYIYNYIKGDDKDVLCIFFVYLVGDWGN